jgi:hypothetical protein
VEEQFGFRPGRGCRDPLFVLREIVRNRTGRTVYAAFMDIKEAHRWGRHPLLFVFIYNHKGFKMYCKAWQAALFDQVHTKSRTHHNYKKKYLCASLNDIKFILPGIPVRTVPKSRWICV